MTSLQGMLEGFDPPTTHRADIARVLVDVDLSHMDRPLDYVIPEKLADAAAVGALVRVRFSGARVDGWIVERSRREVGAGTARIESVTSSLPVLAPAIYETARRIASRFLATTSQVLSLAIPVRHARAEKEAREALAPAWPSVECDEDGRGWQAYHAGARWCLVSGRGSPHVQLSRRFAPAFANASSRPSRLPSRLAAALSW